MKIPKYLFAQMALLFLTACHHPLDCAVGGGFGALHDDCLPGTAGYEENPQKYRGAKLKEGSEKSAEILKECADKYHSGELKTHLETFKCSDPRLMELYQQLGYENMDLFAIFEAKRQKIAQQLDEKKITEIDARIKIAELQKEWNDEARKRNMDSMAANSQFIQATSQQRSDNTALLLGLMPKPQPMPQPYMVPVSPTVNTNCNVLGNNINCTSR